jgi:hypothetical protein
MVDHLADSARGEAELARQLATLAFAAVEPAAGTALQAAVWWNGLVKLGLSPPLVVVHDLGLLLSRPRGARLREAGAPRIPGRLPGAEAAAVSRYRILLEAVAASEARTALEGAVALRDEVVVILLARLLGDLHRRWAVGERTVGLLPMLPLASPLYGRPIADLRRQQSADWAIGFLKALGDEQGILLVRLEQTELGVFRLFGLSSSATLPELPELYQLASTVGAGQIAEFSLQLLPSLLETKRAAAVQRFAVDGYASVERRGSVDALLPGELAHDSEIFAQRALSEELLYYGHQRPNEGHKRTHGILIDASASMRGSREVVARGLGLALARKLTLLGGEVWLSFFDSRLHRRVEAAALGGRELPYLLCFRSEQGRNYARVFGELRDELARPGRDSSGRQVAITIITHGECHIPLAVMQALRRHAAVYGIFVLPTQPLDLEYLPLLSGHQIISAESIAHPADRRRRALDVVSDVVASTRDTGAPAKV